MNNTSDFSKHYLNKVAKELKIRRTEIIEFMDAVNSIIEENKEKLITEELAKLMQINIKEYEILMDIYRVKLLCFRRYS